MAVPCWRGQEPGSWETCDAGWLSSPNLLVKAWGFLESCCSWFYIGNCKKLVLIRVTECSSNKADELANKSERQKAKFPSSMSFYLGCHQKVGHPHLGWNFLLQII